ncbi:hypothetical protein OQA88_13118 [Cercophora sp. LCS_1]
MAFHMPSTPPSPTPTEITLTGNNTLEWASSPPTPLNLDEIILIRKRPLRIGGYIIYSLPSLLPPFQIKSQFASSLPESHLSHLLVTSLPQHLTANPITIIVSTKSGLGHALPFWESVLQPLLHGLGILPDDENGKDGSESGSDSSDDGYTARYRLIVTESEHTIRDYAAQQSNDNNGLTILLSGDGGVVDLINGASGRTVAVLPLGTGNALFHSLGGGDLIRGVRTLFTGTVKPLPTLHATFSSGARLISTGNKIDSLYGCIVASYGFHASLVYESDTPAYRVHGDKRFGMAAGELLKLSHAYDAKVEVKHTGQLKWKGLGQTWNYVLATMVSNLEKTFKISPESKPLDGKLRLVTFGNVGGERTMEVMKAAYAGGEHVGMRWEDGKGVGYEEVEEVRVTVEEEDARWRVMCIDGTIVQVERGGWMSVRRAGEERTEVLVGRDVV